MQQLHFLKKSKLFSVLLVLLVFIPTFIPALAAEDPPAIVSVIPNQDSTFFIDESGTLWGMGYMGYDWDSGTEIWYDAPVQMANDVASVATGSTHYLVAFIKKDGSLWVLGDNSRLFNAYDIEDSEMLTPHKIMEQIALASIHDESVYAVDTQNALWVWGDETGYYGDNYYSAPVFIMDHVSQVDAIDNIMVIKTDGSLWGWGSGDSLGMDPFAPGYPEDYTTPLKVSDHVASIFQDGATAYYIKEDGTLWTTGFDGRTDRYRTDYVFIMDDVQSVGTDGNYDLALKTDHTVWAWGSVDGGLIASQAGESVTCEIPTKIMDGIRSISAFGGVSAIKNDGTVLLWGTHGTHPYPSPTVFTLPSPAAITPQVKSAHPNASAILIDGEPALLQAYTIYDEQGYGTNYVKLRDVAYLLQKTSAQFSIEWDSQGNRIFVTLGGIYTVVGGEMTEAPSTVKEATSSSSSVYIVNYDGEPYEMDAYLIDSNNYFKLRDLGKLAGFGVTWDNATNTISIDTTVMHG